MAVNINVPSQVKTYANLAAFPATGALKTIYIAEDTNKTYRWTGSVYTEISASAAMTWGQIGGTLSNQTDLQNALDAKVPTSRTLTINGVTQDLSANRTFTISTGITIGSTAIASGVVGRVLFEGAGNVVQQSSSLFWDNTNARLGIGTSSPSDVITLLQPIGFQSILRFQTLDNTTANGYSGFNCFDNSGSLAFSFAYGNPNSLLPNSAIIGPRNATGRLSFVTGSSAVSQITMFPSGNLLLQNGGTHTDAGFKLDVNGTARVQNTLTVTKGASNFFTFDAGANGSDLAIRFFKSGQIDVSLSSRNQVNIGGQQIFDGLGVNGGFVATRLAVTSGVIAIGNTGGDALCHLASPNGFSTYVQFRENGVSERGLLGFQNGTSYLQIRTNGATNMSNGTFSTAFFSTGNVAINTTTDAGFRFDVNGTARVQGAFSSTSSITAQFGFIQLGSNANTFPGIINHMGAAQSVAGLNTTRINANTDLSVGYAGAPDASAVIQANSTTKGFLPPRMTTTQRNAIASPAAGLVVYDNTDNKHYGYNGATWNAFY